MIDNNGTWLTDMPGIEQYVEEYRKPLIGMSIEETSETDWQIRHRQREEERQAKRIQIRTSTGSNVYFHKGRPVPTVNDQENKRVAVYARVSTTSTDQTSSIENQQIFYTKKIEENENWELEGIYSDEGKSGMEVKHRTEFLRMIDDAKKGTMDMIICASVSRFARDISDCLKYITKLRTMNPMHPVGVYFETENIYTLDPNSEQVLHFHAMLAHWESANKSRRMILSYDQRICTGQYPVADLLGYRHTKDGRLLIHPDEEKTVRYVFLALVAGFSCSQVAEVLTEKQRTTLKGNKVWTSGMVRGILNNERRWGDLEARKMIVLDPRTKVIVKNNGIRDWAYVPKHHTGIVSPEIAKAAQYMSSSHGMLPTGVPELRVIQHGVLKGYVSICPRWKGIDRMTLIDACRSVYSEKEIECLEQKVRLWSEMEENKASCSDRTGYEVTSGIMFLNRSMPSMTITKKAVKFNRSCHKKLDYCEWIDLLYHPIMQTVALRVGNPSRSNSFRWVTDNGRPCASLAADSFSEIVYDIQHWIPEYQFRFRGITKERGSAKIIIFFLDEPQILIGKGRKKSSENSSIEYIHYTTDFNHEKINENMIAYPEKWRQHGFNCLLQRKRVKMLSMITEEDILNPGIISENPLIGTIPERDTIIKELEDLLLSM